MRKYINKVISHPLFSGSAIMIIGSNSASALNYLYHLVVGRLLGPASYGEFASLISIIGLLGIIPGAVSLVIIKQVSSTKSEEERDNLISWFKSKTFIASLSFALIMLMFFPFISSFLKINNIVYVLLIGVLFLFSLQVGFNRSILQGVLKFKEFVISILVENAAKLVISVLLLLLGFAVAGALAAFVFASLLALFLTNYYLRVKNKSDKPVKINIKPMLILIVPMLIQTISTTSIISSDVVLVKHFFSSHDAGIYASLSTLGKIIFFGAGPITSVMFPMVSKKSSKGESYRQVFIYSFVGSALFALIISFFYWLTPATAINMLFGPAYLESSNLLIWFAIFGSFFTLSSLLVSFGISLGKNKITIFPLFFAILQIILISLFHSSLFTVIVISVVITTLLLVSLLIYLNFDKQLTYGKSVSAGDKVDLDNRPGI